MLFANFNWHFQQKQYKFNTNKYYFGLFKEEI